MSEELTLVRILPADREETVAVDSFLAAAIVRSGVNLVFDCDGQGLCSTCRVRVERGERNLTSITAEERFQLGDDVNRGWRLSCIPRVLGDVTLFVPEEGFAYPPELQRGGSSGGRGND
jgi:ferredoxin